jgi:hypothetical protein
VLIAREDHELAERAPTDLLKSARVLILGIPWIAEKTIAAKFIMESWRGANEIPAPHSFFRGLGREYG